MRVENAPGSFDDLGAYLRQSRIGAGLFDASEGDHIELWGYFSYLWRPTIPEPVIVLELGGKEWQVDAALAGYTLAYSMPQLAEALDGCPADPTDPVTPLFLCPPWPSLVLERVENGIATLSSTGDAGAGVTWECSSVRMLHEFRAYVAWCIPFLDAALALAPSRGLALHRLRFVTYLGWLDASVSLIATE